MMVTAWQHCLALGILVAKETNAFRKNVGSLALVAGALAGGGFQGPRRAEFTLPHPW